jgi:EAL domain-containing protein (putative c-di-GMP-specific phosphodiesterase class I)
MQEAESSIRTLRRLSERGVSIAVDDFGTGYSSLSYLRRLPLKRLKIDRSFVRDLFVSRENAEIVRAIVSPAASLDLHVIAEGVETREQLEAIAHLRCAHYQGFYCCAGARGAAVRAYRRLGARAASRPATSASAELSAQRCVAESILALSEAAR